MSERVKYDQMFLGCQNVSGVLSCMAHILILVCGFVSYVYSYIWYVCSYLVCIHTLVCVFLSGVYFDTGMRILITWGGYH